MLNKIKIFWPIILLFLFFQISNCFGTVIIRRSPPDSAERWDILLRVARLVVQSNSIPEQDDVYVIFENPIYFFFEKIEHPTNEQILAANNAINERDKSVVYFNPVIPGMENRSLTIHIRGQKVYSSSETLQPPLPSEKWGFSRELPTQLTFPQDLSAGQSPVVRPLVSSTNLFTTQSSPFGLKPYDDLSTLPPSQQPPLSMATTAIKADQPVHQLLSGPEETNRQLEELGVSKGLLNFFLNDQVLSQGYVTQNRRPPTIEDLGGNPEDYLHGVPVSAPEAALPAATVKIRVGEKRTAPADDTRGSGEAEPFAKIPSHEQVMHERQVETYMVYTGLLTLNPDTSKAAFSYPMWVLNRDLSKIGKSENKKVVLYNGYRDDFVLIHRIGDMIGEWTMPKITRHVQRNRNIISIQIYDPTIKAPKRRNQIETPKTFLKRNQKSTSTEVEGQSVRLHPTSEKNPKILTFDTTKTPANVLPRVTADAPKPPAKKQRTDDKSSQSDQKDFVNNHFHSW